ncbi:hypothetical protein AAFF_G00233390 [Aldrovandia affinis]|uniref:Uncharacterized protein n=1 Tax=Aldrovandia affinis TaxID=143900 RepID=A0AAD7W402_9TELE|nr:hypothetical protein AAFF_G00233390 [Aldrovandia affinis]
MRANTREKEQGEGAAEQTPSDTCGGLRGSSRRGPTGDGPPPTPTRMQGAAPPGQAETAVGDVTAASAARVRSLASEHETPAPRRSQRSPVGMSSVPTRTPRADMNHRSGEDRRHNPSAHGDSEEPAPSV